MAEFYVSVPRNSMARQIAVLVNKYNRLYKKHSEYSVLKDRADYFVEVVADKVIGCVGLAKKHTTISEIKHVCVHPTYRRRGIAKKLINLAMANCKTPFVYMTIREDNIPSLMTAKSLGFMFVRKDWRKDHNVVTVGRTKENGANCAEK